MVWGLRLCCEGADIREEQKTESNNSTKSWDNASVFPARRKSVKKMACNCVIHCICGKCFNAINKAKLNYYKTLLSSHPKPTASFCSCSPPNSLHAAGNYENKMKGALCKLGQMK